MNQSNARVPYVLAIAAGAVLWAVGSAVSDRREAWDSGTHWAVFYPASIAVCAVLGYLFPERPWRWCLALFAAQFVTMALLSAEIGNLAPLGLVMFGILSLPAIGVAKVTSGMGRKRDA
jgi:hypothetical protein